jgi:hypothetical protein
MNYELALTPEERMAISWVRYRELHPQLDVADARDFTAYIKPFIEVEIQHAKIKWLADLVLHLHHTTNTTIHQQERELAEKVIALRRECHNNLKGVTGAGT